MTDNPTTTRARSPDSPWSNDSVTIVVDPPGDAPANSSETQSSGSEETFPTYIGYAIAGTHSPERHANPSRTDTPQVPTQTIPIHHDTRPPSHELLQYPISNAIPVPSVLDYDAWQFYPSLGNDGIGRWFNRQLYANQQADGTWMYWYLDHTESVQGQQSGLPISHSSDGPIDENEDRVLRAPYETGSATLPSLMPIQQSFWSPHAQFVRQEQVFGRSVDNSSQTAAPQQRFWIPDTWIPDGLMVHVFNGDDNEANFIREMPAAALYRFSRTFEYWYHQNLNQLNPLSSSPLQFILHPPYQTPLTRRAIESALEWIMQSSHYPLVQSRQELPPFPELAPSMEMRDLLAAHATALALALKVFPNEFKTEILSRVNDEEPLSLNTIEASAYAIPAGDGVTRGMIMRLIHYWYYGWYDQETKDRITTLSEEDGMQTFRMMLEHQWHRYYLRHPFRRARRDHNQDFQQREIPAGEHHVHAGEQNPPESGQDAPAEHHPTGEREAPSGEDEAEIPPSNLRRRTKSDGDIQLVNHSLSAFEMISNGDTSVSSPGLLFLSQRMHRRYFSRTEAEARRPRSSSITPLPRLRRQPSPVQTTPSPEIQRPNLPPSSYMMQPENTANHMAIRNDQRLRTPRSVRWDLPPHSNEAPSALPDSAPSERPGRKSHRRRLRRTGGPRAASDLTHITNIGSRTDEARSDSPR